MSIEKIMGNENVNFLLNYNQAIQPPFDHPKICWISNFATAKFKFCV
jgi:hypothetical protein